MAADDVLEPSAADGGGRRHRNSDRASAASLRHSLSRSFAQSDRNRLDLAGTNHPDLQDITDLCSGKRILYSIHVFDRLSPQFEKHVSEEHSGLFCRPTFFDMHDKQAGSRFSRQLRAHIFWHLHRLHRNAQIGPSNVSFFEEFFDNAVHRHHRYRHGSSMTEASRIDAENFAFGIEQRSTGKSWILGEVEPDVLIDPSPAPASPLAADAANDPAACH